MYAKSRPFPAQHGLSDLSTSCGAFDFNLGCSGYEYGLAIAEGLITGGMAKNVLLLTAETYNKYLHPKDKSNKTIFGDGASATLISTEGFAEIGKFSFGTDGRGGKSLIVGTGASRNREKLNDTTFDEDGTPKSSDFLFMDGRSIFDFTVRAVPPMINDILAKNGLTKNEIDLFVFHQANKYMINFLRKIIGIEKDKFYVYLNDVGTTVSSTIPIALCEARKEGRLKGRVILAGFGVGFSWGGCLITVKNN